MSLPWPNWTEAEWREKLGMRAAYSPTQPRDDKGRWTDGGGVTFLHGTQLDAVQTVLREGIRPDPPSHIHKTEIRKKPLAVAGHIYVTANEREARAYAESAALQADQRILDPVYAESFGSLTPANPPNVRPRTDQIPFYLAGTVVTGAAVVGVKIPADVAGRMPRDPRSDILSPPGRRIVSPDARMFKGRIPPEWITSISYQTRDVVSGQEEWHTVPASQFVAPGGTPMRGMADDVWYVPVVLGNTSGLRLAYSADQPRAPKGTPIGGQWTSTGTTASTPGVTSGGDAERERLGSAILDAEAAAIDRYPDLANKARNAPLKRTVSLALGAATGEDPQVISNIVRQWAYSSGDSRPPSIKLQQVAREVYGLPEDSIQHLPDPSEGRRQTGDIDAALGLPEGGNRHAEVMDKYIRAEYAATQKFLKERGIAGPVTLYRGVHSLRDKLPTEADDYEINASPLSSWTTDIETARQFAGYGGRVLTATIPITRIAATPATGRGASYEYEALVIGGRMRVRVRRASDSDEEIRGTVRGLAEALDSTPTPGPLVHIDSDDYDADWPKRTPDAYNWDGTLDPECLIASARYGYDPTQPRVPSGSPGGGQWTSGGGTTVQHSETDTAPSGTPTPTATGGGYLKDRLSGFRHLLPADLPADMAAHMHIDRTQTPHPLPAASIEGAALAFADLKEKAPGLYAFIQKEVPLAQAAYEPKNASATTVAGHGNQWVIFNTEPEQLASLANESLNYNVAQRRAKALGLTGDAYVREVYRGVVLHELGHVFDNALGGRLSNALTATLFTKVAGEKRGTDTERTTYLMKFLERHVSPYAVEAGPQEAAAEFFTAAMLGHPIPRELHGLRDTLLQLAKRIT